MAGRIQALNMESTPAAETKRTSQAGDENEPAFTLLGTANLDRTAGRYWSDSYLMLTKTFRVHIEGENSLSGVCTGSLVNWVGSQSVPEPIPPRFAGAVHSGLTTLLEGEHKGVKLSREELRMIACWIDLLVPYCGDYLEANAWSEDELNKYEHFAAKRRRMEELEQHNIRELVESAEKARTAGVTRNMR